MNLHQTTTFKSGSIILAVPLLIAGLFFMFLGTFLILNEIGVINTDIENKGSMFVNVSVMLLPLTIGLMSVIGSYRLVTKKEGIFPKWFIVVFSFLFILGIIIVIVTTKNFTLLGLIIGILIFNYHKFFKKRKKNQAINSSRYFR